MNREILMWRGHALVFEGGWWSGRIARPTMTEDELQAIEGRLKLSRVDVSSDTIGVRAANVVISNDVAALVAEVRRCVEALRAIINASDDCQGHRDCDHSMKPWGDARIIVHEFDGDTEALEEQRRLMATHPRYNE